MACIYRIKNITNNLVYIGRTKHSAERRFEQHWGHRKEEKTSRLGLAFLLEPKSNFVVETIVEGDFNETLLNELEKHYIRLHASTFPHKGYNKHIGGRMGWTKGMMTEENKKATSLRMTGNTYHRKRIVQCKKDGTEIREWFGVKICSKELNIVESSIFRVLKGKRKSAGGFIFKYKTPY